MTPETARQVSDKLRREFAQLYWTLVQHRRAAGGRRNIFVNEDDALMKRKSPASYGRKALQFGRNN